MEFWGILGVVLLLKVLSVWIYQAYVRSWIKRTGIYVYCSHFLSAWGDRMWSFGVGLFLIEIAPESLQLTAIYGLCNGGAVLLLGPLIGDWVDRTARLTAARVTLVSQNVCVILSAVVVCLLLFFQTQISTYWDGWLTTLCHSLLILFAVLAQLASVGNTISIERDWIVEICGRNSDRLTIMTATMRRIDLSTNIIAPIVTGQIIGFGSLVFGAIFIAGWNLVSVFVEYILLKKVYDSVPELARKKDSGRLEVTKIDAGQQTPDVVTEINVTSPGTCSTLCSRLVLLVLGWKVYMKYPVAYAGIALGCLFMTVLGFDNITTGYAYSQGISESVLGLMMGVGAITGIAGTFAFPLIKSKVGLVRTGLFSMAFQTLCLIPCVVSVWASGSPFDPHFLSDISLTTVAPPNQTLSPSQAVDDKLVIPSNQTTTDGWTEDDVSTIYPPQAPEENQFLSIWLLLGGIVTARFGLWISDLTISQQILETVEEAERGTFGGVQTSFNMLMDLIKNALVVAAPQPELFGILIIISFGFTLLANVFYAGYSKTLRKHILPFHRLLCADERSSKRMPATN